MTCCWNGVGSKCYFGQAIPMPAGKPWNWRSSWLFIEQPIHCSGSGNSSTLYRLHHWETCSRKKRGYGNGTTKITANQPYKTKSARTLCHRILKYRESMRICGSMRIFQPYRRRFTAIMQRRLEVILPLEPAGGAVQRYASTSFGIFLMMARQVAIHDTGSHYPEISSTTRTLYVKVATVDISSGKYSVCWSKSSLPRTRDFPTYHCVNSWHVFHYHLLLLMIHSFDVCNCEVYASFKLIGCIYPLQDP